MSDFTKRLREATKNATFCYAKEGGQGFVQKENCTCRENDLCHSLQDAERFHKRFHEMRQELGYGQDFGIKERNEIIKIIKPEFADSVWWKNNVVE